MSKESGRCTVAVSRGGTVESEHEVSVAVVEPQGALRAFAGDPNRATFARSSIKAMQALPLLEDGAAAALGLVEEEIALCCASHSGEPRHVELARSILRKAGADEQQLACGAHWPFHEESARALREQGERPGRIHNNCSGKHAGMLALAHFHGWPAEGYHRRTHPVQQRMLQEVVRWTGAAVEQVSIGVDGCGVATFSLPLFALALGFARLSAESRRGGSAAAAVIAAMMAHPYLVGGTDRLCTALMQCAPGRIFAKVGAEGVYCAGVPGAELGIALKVHDGAVRAAEPALLSVLSALGLLGEAEQATLARWASPDVSNTRGESVGSVRCNVRLQVGHG